MPYLDISAIQTSLYSNRDIRNRLMRDFGLDRSDSEQEFIESLLSQFDQAPVENPLRRRVCNEETYKAAVNALASNNRSWAAFLRNRQRLETLLGDYDLQTVPDIEAVAACLPGQTSRSDARSICRWREKLAEDQNYYDRLTRAGRTFRELGVTDAEILPCVAVFVGNAPLPRRVAGELKSLLTALAPGAWKTPGMGPTLASEFLRNLGWSGFKPDRHVMRLLDAWAPEAVASSKERATALAGLLGTRAKPTIDFLAYSLAGVAITPPGTPYSLADNLIWALGAYVEKKGRESARTYVI